MVAERLKQKLKAVRGDRVAEARDQEQNRITEQRRREAQFQAHQAATRAVLTDGYAPQSMSHDGPNRAQSPPVIADASRASGPIPMPNHLRYLYPEQQQGPTPPPKEQLPEEALPAYTEHADNEHDVRTTSPGHRNTATSLTISSSQHPPSLTPGNAHSNSIETRARTRSNRYGTDIVVTTGQSQSQQNERRYNGSANGTGVGRSPSPSYQAFSRPQPPTGANEHEHASNANGGFHSSDSDQSDLETEEERPSRDVRQSQGHRRVSLSETFELSDSNVEQQDGPAGRRSPLLRGDRPGIGHATESSTQARVARPQNGRQPAGSDDRNRNSNEAEVINSLSSSTDSQRYHNTQQTSPRKPVASRAQVQDREEDDYTSASQSQNIASNDQRRAEVIAEDQLRASNEHAEDVELLRAEKTSLERTTQDLQQNIHVLNLELRNMGEAKNGLEQDLIGQRQLLADTENALQVCRTNFTKSSKSLDQAKSQIAEIQKKLDSSERSKQNYVDTMEKLNDQLNGLAKDYAELEEHHAEELKGSRASKAEELSEMQQLHEAELVILQRSLKDTEMQARKQLRDMEASHTNKLQLSVQEQSEKVAMMVDRYEKKIAGLRQEQKTLTSSHTQAVERAERTRRQDLADLRQKLQSENDVLNQKLHTTELAYEEQTQNLTTVHAQQIKKLGKDHNLALMHKQAEVDRVKEDAELRITRQASSHEQELADQRSHYKHQTREIREENRRLKESLLSRDDDMYRGAMFSTAGLPAQTDDRIFARFSSIQKLIDDLARLQWKTSPSVWTNEVLDKIRGKTVDRILKRAIVQDTIWCLLYHYFICSPFRAFGDVGRSLEVDWNRACGSGTL